MWMRGGGGGEKNSLRSSEPIITRPVRGPPAGDRKADDGKPSKTRPDWKKERTKEKCRVELTASFGSVCGGKSRGSHDCQPRSTCVVHLSLFIPSQLSNGPSIGSVVHVFRDKTFPCRLGFFFSFHRHRRRHTFSRQQRAVCNWWPTHFQALADEDEGPLFWKRSSVRNDEPASNEEY